MRVLGISGLHRSVAFKKSHFPKLSRNQARIVQGLDSAAALVDDSGVVAAAAEERFAREKGTGTFPILAIEDCLRVAGIRASELDFIAHGFSYGPHKSELSTDDYARAQYDEVYDPSVQLEYLCEFVPGTDWSKRFISVPHHIAHASSVFHLSGFDEALVVVSDGMGEVESMTALRASAGGFEVLKTVAAAHSIGALYGAFTLYLGFCFNMDEYKVMGLAPYGDARRYYGAIMDMVKLKADGTYAIPAMAASSTVEDRETMGGVLRILEQCFGPAREPESALLQHHMDLAAAIQSVLETTQMHVLRHLKRQTGAENLCMAGGVALNCSANGLIAKSRLFESVCFQPASGDDGSALGAALYVHAQHEPGCYPRKMSLPLWGTEYGDDEIRTELRRYNDCNVVSFRSSDELVHETVRLIAEGKVLAWFQGRMEFGPRALGNRSILGNPLLPEMRDKVNALVKKRESFRPFAPAVTEESASVYFHIAEDDVAAYRHMLIVTQVRSSYRTLLPAITHVNGSARVQTVARQDSTLFWQLLTEFGRQVGHPVLLNTSFNVRGQPIVRTPREALDTFLEANLDGLVIGNHLVTRAEVNERSMLR